MSWKQYGGTSNFETNKQITTNTIITDEIVLKKSYVGGFTIRGILDVTGKAIIQGDLELTGVFDVTDISVKKLTSDANYFNTINSVNSINCIGNTIINNTLTSKDILVNNNIKVGNLINLKGNKFIYSDVSGIGFNTLHPKATIDICCTSIEGINIYSDFSKNINVISSNKERNGIVISTIKDTNSKAGIDFYINNKIDTSNNGDAYIHYDDSSILEIHSSDKIISTSNFYITNRANNSNNIYNESLVVYDNSSSIYNYDIYNNPTAITGDGITIVTNDNSSNSFLRIVSPNGSGLGIVGGAYPNDVKRSMTSIGITDSCGNFIPNQTIVSSSIKGKYKTTMGINTYKPNTEKYVVDINGPLHIDNGDVNLVNMSHFEILSMDSKQNLTIAVGSSIDVSSSTYTNVVLVSYDYGSSWMINDLSGITISSGGGLSLNDIKKGTIDGLNYTLNSVYVYDNTTAIIVGNNNLILITKDGGNTWYFMDFPDINVIYDFKQVIVSNDIDSPVNLILYIYGETLNKNSFLKCYISKTIVDQYVDPYFIKDISNNIIIRSFDIHIDSIKSKVYFATNNGIWYMNLYNNNILIDNRDISPNNIVQTIDSSLNSFNFIKIYGSSVITLSSNSVSNSTISDNLGISKFQLYTNNHNLSKLYVYDEVNYLSISSNKQLFYTNNAGKTWSKIPDYFYNLSGKESIVNDISNISQILMSDNNTVIISDVKQGYKQYIQQGKSNIINLFVPKLFNSIHNHVLDVCGNMNITGSIYIQEGGLRSNNDTFHLLNENVSNLIIGGETQSINIGNKIGGNTNIVANLNVNNNSLFNGNVLFNGIQTIGNSSESHTISTGSLITNGGIGIRGNVNIGGNLNVHNNVRLNNNLYVHKISEFNDNVLFNGIQTIDNSTESNTISTGSLITNGGIGIFGNTNIGGNLNVHNNVRLNNNLYVHKISEFNDNVLFNGVQTINNTTQSTATTNGALVVNGGVGILGNNNIGGNLVIQQNSRLVGNVLVHGIQTISNSTESTQITNGALIVNGGIGILGNTNIGGNLNVNNNVRLNNDLYVNNNSILNGTVLFNSIQTIGNTNQSHSTSTGALVVNGGVGIFGNTNIGGNLLVNNRSIFTGNLNIRSPDIQSIHTLGGIFSSKSIESAEDILLVGNIINKTFSSTNDTIPIQFSDSKYISDVFVRKNMDNLIDDISGQKNFKGIINIQNPTDSTITSGALFVSGGVGIQKQLVVNGNIISNGVLTTNNTLITNGNIVSWSNVGIGKIQDSNYKLDVLGDINVNGNIHATNVKYDNLLNIYSNNTNGQLNIGKAPSTTNTQLINIGESVKNVNIARHDLNGNAGILNVGGGIGEFGPGIDNIIIGGQNTRIKLNGFVEFLNQSINLTSVIQFSRTFILSDESLFAISNLYNKNSVNGGGILFQGFNDQSVPVTNLGQFTISLDGQGYIFKAPTYNEYVEYTGDPTRTKQNILRLDVNTLTTTANNGLIILKPSITDDDNSKYTITSSNIDISNIFIKDKDQTVTGTTQSISTDVINKGNVYFNKNVNINTSNFINNCSLNVNGSAIISKLGVGTSSVNTEPNSLEVQGNVYQVNNGYIYQF